MLLHDSIQVMHPWLDHDLTGKLCTFEGLTLAGTWCFSVLHWWGSSWWQDQGIVQFPHSILSISPLQLLRNLQRDTLRPCHDLPHCITFPEDIASTDDSWPSQSLLSCLENGDFQCHHSIHSFQSKVKVKSLSCVWLFVTLWTVACRLLYPRDFPGKSTGVQRPNPTEPRSSTFQADALPSEPFFSQCKLLTCWPEPSFSFSLHYYTHGFLFYLRGK